MNELISGVSQFNLIWIAIPSLVLIAVILLLLFRNSRNLIKSSDGSVFNTNEERDKYEKSFQKINSIFNSIDSDPKLISDMGIDLEFINNLKDKGLPDAKTVLKYRNQLKLLVELLE